MKNLGKYYLEAQESLFYYAPIWYTNIMINANQAFKLLIDFIFILWNKSEQLSIIAIDYIEYFVICVS
jgi:hypothetical protein